MNKPITQGQIFPNAQTRIPVQANYHTLGSNLYSQRQLGSPQPRINKIVTQTSSPPPYYRSHKVLPQVQHVQFEALSHPKLAQLNSKMGQLETSFQSMRA
jgi:hypothetical protein